MAGKSRWTERISCSNRWTTISISGNRGITMFVGKVSPLLACLTLIGFSSASAQVRKPADVSNGVQQIVYYSPQARKIFLATVPGFKAGTSATEKVLMVKTLDRQNG